MRTRIVSLAIAFVVAVALASCADGAPEDSAQEAGRPTVEVAALHHPPLKEVLAQVDSILASAGDAVAVKRYDLETPEGQSFAEEHGLQGHLPLAILINGSPETTVRGRKVRFLLFPQGYAPLSEVEGSWRLDDLRAAVRRLARARR